MTHSRHITHVARANASCDVSRWCCTSCRMHEWVMAHVCMSHVTYMDESCHIYERVMSYVWTSDGTYMTWVMSFAWMSHVTHINESHHIYEWVPPHIYQCVTSHIWMSQGISPCHTHFYVTHISMSRTFLWNEESCAWMRHVKKCVWHDAFTCVTAYHHVTHIFMTWRVSFICVMWLIYMYHHVTHISMTWRFIRMNESCDRCVCDMTHSHVWRVSFIWYVQGVWVAEFSSCHSFFSYSDGIGKRRMTILRGVVCFMEMCAFCMTRASCVWSEALRCATCGDVWQIQMDI